MEARASMFNRGLILRTMVDFFPDKITLKRLQTLVGKEVTRRELFKHIYYLEDKGYIKVSDPYEDLTDETKVIITAKGIDLIEATLDDPAITL